MRTGAEGDDQDILAPALQPKIRLNHYLLTTKKHRTKITAPVLVVRTVSRIARVHFCIMRKRRDAHLVDLDDRLAVTIERAADVLDVGRSTVYELLRTGKLKGIKLGRAHRVVVQHAAVSALVECGTKRSSIRSLADLVTPHNLKSILRRRLESAGGQENTFNHLLGRVLLQIASEWVKVDPSVLAELKRLVGKLPVPPLGLTAKNKRFLRQFDDPNALLRLVQLPEQLWAQVKRDSKPSFRTLAKAQAALAIAILTYMPLRLQNLSDLAFDTHLFIGAGSGAISTLELSNGEVKNKTELAFDIPPASPRCCWNIATASPQGSSAVVQRGYL